MPPTDPRPAVALALAVLLSGCAAVGPDFAPPSAPADVGYQMDHAGPPPLVPASETPWWKAFGSPALDAAIAQALTDSPTLAEADATLAQSASALAQARGERLPQIDVNGGAERRRANLQSFGFTSFGGAPVRNPTFSLYSVGGAVIYDLDLFGKERRRVESVEARMDAQSRRAQAAYLTLTANVALQAATIAAVTEEIEAVESMIAADQAEVDLVGRAIAIGGATQTARLSAQSKLEEDRAKSPPLRKELAAARNALAQLVGHAPATWSAPRFRLSDFAGVAEAPLALPSALVRSRPDILAAEADLHAATAEIGVATADLYPDIRLTASFAQGALQPENLFSYDSTAWSLGAGLTAPIFHGGALRARRDQAVMAAQAADARYRQTVLAAFVQVADALDALEADRTAIATFERAAAQAQDRLRLARLAVKKGGGTLHQVYDAERQLHEVQADARRADGRRLADTVRLFAATGADWRASAAEPLPAATSARP